MRSSLTKDDVARYTLPEGPLSPFNTKSEPPTIIILSGAILKRLSRVRID